MKRLSVATVLVLALSAGCTGGEEQSPESGSPSDAPAIFEPEDRSADALDLAPLTSIGSSTGTLEAHRKTHALTLHVGKVETSDVGTIMTFWYTADVEREVLFGDLDPQAWVDHPELVEPTSGSVYRPVIYERQGVWESDGGLCLCTDVEVLRSTPIVRTILYPELPEGATSVEVRQAGFKDPIVVPVSR